MASLYSDLIRAALKRHRIEGIEPHHVEAFMRAEHSTLDGLSKEQFAAEVAVSAECVAYVGPAEAEAVAQSFGLSR